MRTEKKAVVKELKRVIDGAAMLILADHSGLSAHKMNELRARLKRGGSQYIVVKNRSLKRAFDEGSVMALEANLEGPTGIAVTGGDCKVLSEVIVKFARENEAPRVKLAFWGGRLLSAEQIGLLAFLPSKDVLISRLLGGMRSPVAGFVLGCRELLRGFVSVVNQIAAKRGD